MKYLTSLFVFIISIQAQDIDEVSRVLMGKHEGFVKCSRPHYLYFLANQEKFDSQTQHFVKKKILERSKKTDFSYLSPSGKFKINYSLNGSNAVSPVSVDGDTIPDYVQRIAEYCDFSYQVEVVQHGYIDPVLPGSPYRVDIVEMGGTYGTTKEDGNGSTYISVDNNYTGFPSNNDSNQALGAAKVTVAHEFKHAIHYVTDKALFLNFSDYWVETDATWTEELVYDHVDDYYNYLASSQLRNPSRSLHRLTSTGTYGDVIFQLAFTEQYGNKKMIDFWKNRKSFPSDTYYQTFQTILGGENGFKAFVKNYFTWNNYTGKRSRSGFSYSEAAAYPYYTINKEITESNNSYIGNIKSMSAVPHRINIKNDKYILFEMPVKSNVFLTVNGIKDGSVISHDDILSGANRVVNTKFRSNQYDSLYLIIYSTDIGSKNESYLVNVKSSSKPFTVSPSKKITLQRNPVMQDLLLSSDDNESIKYEIYNVLGQRVKKGYSYKKKDHRINISHIASGIYFIKVNIDSYQNFLKFVKVK